MILLYFLATTEAVLETYLLKSAYVMDEITSSNYSHCEDACNNRTFCDFTHFVETTSICRLGSVCKEGCSFEIINIETTYSVQVIDL